MRKGIAALFVLFLIGAVLAFPWYKGIFVSKGKALRTVSDNGYTNAVVVSRAVLFVNYRGCGDDDTVRFTVAADNPAKERREVYVCASFLKGGTIRSK